MAIHIHVDGSHSRERDNACGYGFVVFDGEKMIDFQKGTFPYTRSKNIEAVAALEAVKYVRKKFGESSQIAVFTDSYDGARAPSIISVQMCAAKGSTGQSCRDICISTIFVRTLLR